MQRFENLDTDEQRNEILKGIHNQLAQINKWLEVIAVQYAKLSAEDTEFLRYDAAEIEDNLECVSYRNGSNVGYTQARGMYKSFLNGGEETREPLGEYDRTAPIDEKTGFFIEND